MPSVVPENPMTDVENTLTTADDPSSPTRDAVESTRTVVSRRTRTAGVGDPESSGRVDHSHTAMVHIPSRVLIEDEGHAEHDGMTQEEHSGKALLLIQGQLHMACAGWHVSACH